MSQKKFIAILTSTLDSLEGISLERTEFTYSKDAIVEVNRQLNEHAMNSRHTKLILKLPQEKKNIILQPLKTRHGDEDGFEIDIGFVSESKLVSKGNDLLIEASVIVTDDNVAREIDHKKGLFCFFPVIMFSEKKSVRVLSNGMYEIIPPVKVALLNVGTKRSSSNPNVRIK